LQVTPAELCQPRGCESSDTPQPPPHDRSHDGFFPNLIGLGHLLSRVDARWLPEKGSTRRPRGTGLLRINPPQLATLAHGQPLEPPSRHLREKLPGQPHPRRLPPPSPLRSELPRVGTFRPGLATGPQPSSLIGREGLATRRLLDHPTSPTLTSRGADGSTTERLEEALCPPALERPQRPRRFLRLEVSVS
jgi:hypothetical protein